MLSITERMANFAQGGHGLTGCSTFGITERAIFVTGTVVRFPGAVRALCAAKLAEPLLLSGGAKGALRAHLAGRPVWATSLAAEDPVTFICLRIVFFLLVVKGIDHYWKYFVQGAKANGR